MAMVAAKCTMCGSSIKVDDSQEKGVCEHCGTEFITEKVINVTNITNVDNSTNIYYGETTDSKVKKDLEKAYKTLKAAGYDYVNLKLEGTNLDPTLCKTAYNLAHEVVKKDPTNYDGWRCLVLMHYAAYMEDEYQWLYGKNDGLGDYNFDQILEELLRGLNTATKVAPNASEKEWIDTLRQNAKINYYKEKLISKSASASVAERVDYVKKPEQKNKFPKAMVWIGGYIAAMGLLLLLSLFIPLGTYINMEKSMVIPTSIPLIAIGAIVIGIYLFRNNIVKKYEQKLVDIKNENTRRFNEKLDEVKNDAASAKTLKDYEALADKYNIDKI